MMPFINTSQSAIFRPSVWVARLAQGGAVIMFPCCGESAMLQGHPRHPANVNTEHCGSENAEQAGYRAEQSLAQHIRTHAVLLKLTSSLDQCE